jgi:citrate synthase
MGELVDARTAASRLGVDVRTLYAYVSRGSLRRVPGPDGRSSRYDSADVELLAQRSRPRTLPRPAASIDVMIATRVSTVADGVVRYRGKDVLELVAAGEPFERVADLLWGGPPGGWGGPIAGLSCVPGGDVPVLKRFAIAVAMMTDATDCTPDWAAFGRRIVECLTEAGPRNASGRPSGEAPEDPGDARGIALRLWRRWSPLSPATPRVRALNTALVLLAEHELALSTLSVRVAASARATPGACILAGLSTLSGALHGGAARALHEMLLARAGGGQQGTPQAVAFGHLVHRHGDPRTAPLLSAVYGFASPADRDLIESVRQEAAGRPNIDFALGALTYCARMPPEAASAIFAIARTAGWVAHAAEEYGEPPLRFRGRAFRTNRAASPGP